MEPSQPRAELIVYACPTGDLAAQIEGFYRSSRERFGANSAHAYPPHITLTGFFHDEPRSIPDYVAALGAAHAAALPTRPAPPLTIGEMVTTGEFHGLLIASSWLEALAADFAARAASPTRSDALRLKRWLHLSLAYGFRPEDGPGLGAMARAMVSPAAPAGWELRLYERLLGGAWALHGAWPI